ncbi:MAG: trigger factor [Legionellaceae bacterium]|nr:trigger factor [Legionellaceae bacterium]
MADMSLETLSSLERKITITIPGQEVENEFSSRLLELSGEVKVKGFRPGKVPLHVVEKRYNSAILDEVARALIPKELSAAIDVHSLNLVSMPVVNPEPIERGKDFSFSATFEVYPEFTIESLKKDDEVELLECTLEDADVTHFIDELRQQFRTWDEVSQAAESGNTVIMDFDGSIDGEPMANGKAEGFRLELGKGQMIPGFEEGIIGRMPGTSFDIEVTFPAEYHSQDVAGKLAVFHITLKTVLKANLPELDEAFLRSFDIENGDLETFRKDIRHHLELQVKQNLAERNKEILFAKWAEKNEFELPKKLINDEINEMRHEMYHRINGNQHHQHEKVPEYPRELFEDAAKKRVHLGLLVSEFIKKNEVVPASDKINAAVAERASLYKNPEEMIAEIIRDKRRMANIEAQVLEQMVMDDLLQQLKIQYKKVDFSTLKAKTE